MKEFKAVKMIAKNSPAGSYVAGCPAESRCSGSTSLDRRCLSCERTQ